MPTVNEIKEERTFNAELSNLLEVLKAVSVTRFRALQARVRRLKIFLPLLKEFYRMVDLKAFPHPFVNPENRRIALVIITSDEGFMGELNLQVIEKAFAASESEYSELIMVGERGERYLRDIGKECTLFKGPRMSVGERYDLAIRLKDHVLKGVKEGRFGHAIVFYTRPESFIIQKVEAQGLLPLKLPAEPYRDEVIIDSPLGEIVEFFAEEEVIYKLTDALEDSKLSEYAARAIHLEKSTRILEDREKELKFKYFRAYHEKIDKNIRELFAAQVIRVIR